MGRQGDPESVEATQLPKGTRDIALQWRPAGAGMRGVGYKGRRYSTLYVSIFIQQTVTITLTSSQYGPSDKSDSEKATVKSS